MPGVLDFPVTDSIIKGRGEGGGVNCCYLWGELSHLQQVCGTDNHILIASFWWLQGNLGSLPNSKAKIGNTFWEQFSVRKNRQTETCVLEKHTLWILVSFPAAVYCDGIYSVWVQFNKHMQVLCPRLCPHGHFCALKQSWHSVCCYYSGFIITSLLFFHLRCEEGLALLQLLRLSVRIDWLLTSLVWLSERRRERRTLRSHSARPGCSLVVAIEIKTTCSGNLPVSFQLYLTLKCWISRVSWKYLLHFPCLEIFDLEFVYLKWLFFFILHFSIV